MIKLMKSAFFKEQQIKNLLVDFILGSEILSMNGQCKKFEKDFAKKQQRKFAIMVNSGSSANLVLIQSLINLGRLKKEAFIGFSALTWATNIMPLVQLGLKPIPLDCEINTLNVSPAKLKEQIKNLNGLFLTNVLGFSDNIPEIAEICKEHNIVFIEDNCESLGSKTGGKLLGNFSLASTFSFFVGHHLSTIEGGMICTDDEELADMLTIVRAHGWDRNLSPEKQQHLRQSAIVDNFYAKYTFYDLAYGLRPTEITGFLGNTQLPYLDEIIQKRKENFKKFQEIAEKNQNLIPLDLTHMEIVSNFAMPVVCKDKEKLEKYKTAFSLQAEIRPIIAGDMTKQPFYKKYKLPQLPCPNSAFVHKCGFYFPNNPELTEDEIETLCKLLKE